MVENDIRGNVDIPTDVWSLIWKVKYMRRFFFFFGEIIHVKIITFVWKILLDCLPVNLNLISRGILASCTKQVLLVLALI